MASETVRVERSGHFVRVTIDRPAKLNALSAEVLTSIDDTFASLADEPLGAVRGAILAGAGGRAFAAGADIAEMARMSPEEGADFARLGQEATTRIEDAPFPVIACVDGFAFGGGCELAMACDFIYATEAARFSQPEVSLGLIATFGGCVRLAHLVGPARAKEMLYTGKSLTAQEALTYGLAAAVLPDAESLFSAAEDTLRLIATRSPNAVAISKRVVQESYNRPVAEGLAAEQAGFADALRSPESTQGMTAFHDKRPAGFETR
ncbi:enoyl-CoA hydratase-related protein [Microbacterium sp.]|uniref:enoyl-CoA hydratase/isomerase family protein n=1 Tax=Microbacterium sp. TaxID=51671 RepID=UPI0026283B2E|nr:enoyl-CoA hydratase-related protein [Microbacterium sp.]